jgi:hypothetical protein
MGKLQKWLDQEWVRIDSQGNIKGACGTSKDKRNPDRCLPRSKAQSLSKSQRASTARKKKREGAKGKTYQIPKPQKSQIWQTAVLLCQRQRQNGLSTARIFRGPR